MELREWIKEKGWTVAEFARRLGVARVSVYQWFNNKKPSINTAIRIEKLTEGKIKRSSWEKKEKNSYTVINVEKLMKEIFSKKDK